MLPILVHITKVALVTLPLVWGICLLTADKDRARFYTKWLIKSRKIRRQRWCRVTGAVFLFAGVSLWVYFMRHSLFTAPVVG
jgi:hypothetical protein